MPRADLEFVHFLNANGYHPRSSKHGDALCKYLVQDLVDSCPSFAAAASEDQIVYQSNYTIEPDASDRWNVDLVVGPPMRQPTANAERIGPIVKGDPREIWVAVDAKTIMTEHGKARRNRQRDLNSFQDILHKKNPRTIVGGLLVVNIAERFRTPLARASGGLNQHRNIERLVGEIVAMIEGLVRADAVGSTRGSEALGIIVVSHTNVPGDRTELVTRRPAPQLGAQVSYEVFLSDICAAFTARFR